ncbi:MAG: ABC transporter substrate-binding protein [Deltaproteobacteria bacterium]|nr:ABC transporter substrate-binding protein [Deltaproteobacteria bacterium]
MITAAGRALACALAVTLGACAADPPPLRPGVLSVSVEQQASWVRNFNPLVGGARWPTTAGIYEPLLVHSAVRGLFVPWLATTWSWEDDDRVLRFELRQGVTWSDGAPFTAADVVYTFTLLRDVPALDQGAVWGFLAGVEPDGDHAVRFRFQRAYAPGLDGVARQPIVPRHIWSKVADPLRFTNPEPVGTGPFTEVLLFRNQVWELGRNPRYWQPGKPAVEALRFLAYPANDQANMALVTGELDWAGNFVPAIDRTYVAADPAHRTYWFPLVGSTVFLYTNTTRAPLGDVRVRKALSMAIDRELLVEVATYDYTRPADGSALSDAFASWRDPVAAASDWVRFDRERARAALAEAGLRRDPDGLVLGPDGAPLELSLIVVSGWSDWVRAAQVIARDLAAIGVTVRVRTLDFSPWFEKVQTGDFDLAIGWSNEGATPYAFYRWLMSSGTLKPLGQAAAGNWHRFASPEADRLLAAFEQTTDEAEQRRLAVELQRVFAREAPSVPLFPNPSWGVANTTRFEGFPSAADPYAQLSPNPLPECLLVLTRIRPRDAGDKVL